MSSNSTTTSLHRPLSIIGHLSSSSSLSNLNKLRGSPPPILLSTSLLSAPYTLCTLPPVWLAHIFSFISPSEKLSDLIHVNHHIHSILMNRSAAFRDDHLDLAPDILPTLSISSPPWFRGLSSVSAKATGPAWFELDAAIPLNNSEEEQQHRMHQIPQTSSPIPRQNNDDTDNNNSMMMGSSPDSDRTPPVLNPPSFSSPSFTCSSSCPASPSSSCASPTYTYSSTVSPSPLLAGISSPSSSSNNPFTSIRSLSISLSRGSNPMINVSQSHMFNGFHKWTNLRYLEIRADDDDHEHYDCSLITASADTALLRHQHFSAFTMLIHLHTLILDATIRAEQLKELIGMPNLQCLQLTEREQHIWMNEEAWIKEEENMVIILGKVARLVRSGRGLIKLKMPKFHHPSSIDPFCFMLVDDDEEMGYTHISPLASLSIQGIITKKGVAALSALPSLHSLTMGWGCEMDGKESTLASLPSFPGLNTMHIRLTDPNEGEEHDDETYVPVLPSLQHILSVPTLSSLSLHLPPHAWTVAHTDKLSHLSSLRKVRLTGEPSGINSRLPINYNMLLPLIKHQELTNNTILALPHLRVLSLDWLPITDDAVLVLSRLSSLTNLSLVNCPYLTSALFLMLPSLPKLSKLKVYRCDVNMTADGWITAEQEALALYHQHRISPPISLLSIQFPALQVLECHLVHRLSCDVDTPGFARFLSLLPPSHLHSFDFDSDYSTAAQFLLLSSFPHLRSLGTPSVDVCPYDDEATRRAKASFAKVEKIYYSKAYTRIHRGQRKKWRKDRRSSIPIITTTTLANTNTTIPDNNTNNNHDDDDIMLSDEDEDLLDDMDENDSFSKDDDPNNNNSRVDMRRMDREARWVPHYNGVEFRHQAARDAFFIELKNISEEETKEELEAQKQAEEEKLKEKERIAVRKLELEMQMIHSVVQQQQYVDDEQVDDQTAANEYDADYDGEGYEYGNDNDDGIDDDDEKADIDIDAEGDEDDFMDDEDEEDYIGAAGVSSKPLSVTLVGRSLKLHSRRWKRDEKAAIKSKSSLPHNRDGGIARTGNKSEGRRSSDGSWISLKWDHDLVRVVKLSSLH